MKLNQENIEEQILLLVDGELDEATTAAVLAYIGEHEEYKAMLDLYLSTQLEPEQDIVFPDRESLLKKEPLVIAMPVKKPGQTVRQLAAGIALLAGIGVVASIVLLRPEKVTEHPIAKNTSPAAKNKITSPIALATPDSNLAVSVTPVIKHNVTVMVQRSNAVQATVPATKEEPRVKEKLEHLTEVQPEALAMNNEPIAAEQREWQAIPEQQAAITEEKLPSWLPVNDEKLQGVNDLVAQIKELKENIQEKAQTLKHATLVLRFGDKDLALGK